MGPREHMGRPGLRCDSLSWGPGQTQGSRTGLEGKREQTMTKGGGPGEALQNSAPWLSCLCHQPGHCNSLD